MDQFDIALGERWDRAVQQALERCTCLVVALSPSSVQSDTVADECHFALEARKIVIPALYQACDVPFRLRRLQYVDFTAGYENAFRALLNALKPESTPDPNAIRARRWVITGSVQAVGFRFFAQQRAKELELVGWARNLRNGGIDVYAQGTVAKLDALGKTLQKGPAMANVQDVAIEEGDAAVNEDALIQPEGPPTAPTEA